MDESKRMPWDAYIVNDDVEKAYEQLKAVTADGRAACAAARRAAAAAKAAAAAAGGGAAAAGGKCPHKH